jgi:hypothetical protein
MPSSIGAFHVQHSFHPLRKPMLPFPALWFSNAELFAIAISKCVPKIRKWPSQGMIVIKSTKPLNSHRRKIIQSLKVLSLPVKFGQQRSVVCSLLHLENQLAAY